MNQNAAQPLFPEIDPKVIGAFCSVVFSYLDGLVPIRLLAEKGTTNTKPVFEFPKIKAAAARLAAQAELAATTGRGTFIVPGVVVKSGSAKAADICQTGVILIDLDDGDIQCKRDHLAGHVGQPTLEIASGGVTSGGQPKLHLYWRLSEAAGGKDLQRVAHLRAMLSEKVGGDDSFKSLHQPIRVPGTIHGKFGQRAPVRLLEHRAIEYHLEDIAERIITMPALPGAILRIATNIGEIDPFSVADLATRKVRTSGQDGITRFRALSKVIGHWIRNIRIGSSTYDHAWAAVCQYNAAMLDPSWEEGELRREFEGLLRKDVAEKGPMPPRAGGVEPPPLSDDALAAAFVLDHGVNWRHVGALGWLHWDGSVWKRDDTHFVREQIRQVCRNVAAAIEQPREAKRIASDKIMSAVGRVVSSDPNIACRIETLDAYPMLLNTPAGLLDLETGEVGAHDRTRMITQSTTASLGKGCPLWERTLVDITGGDADLQRYLARLAGYCLTGSTREQTFAFIHGPGGNGKSVFLQTIAGVMGDYAATATLDTFMASSQSRHLTELAGLRAARLVLVPETEAGRSWAEARIKTVTGGENLRANFMRQDHFEFRPQFKLIVAGNHRPELRNVGPAMKRRLHLVPFEVKIPEANIDRRLGEKLLEERDGILGWMIEGCVQWQRLGLAPPRSVISAAESYFSDEDMFGQWIDECCILGPDFRALSSSLYQSWKAWAEAAGITTGSKKSLGEELRNRGFVFTKIKGERARQGISLRMAQRSPEGGE